MSNKSTFNFEKFAAILKINSVIWNPRHKEYRVNAVRERAWRNVSRSMDCGVLNCRNKYKTIRDQYRRVLSKEARGEEVSWPLKFKFGFLRRTFKDIPLDDDEESEQDSFDQNTSASYKMEHMEQRSDELRTPEVTEIETDDREDPLQTRRNGFIQIPEPSPLHSFPQQQQPFQRRDNIEIVSAESLRNPTIRVVHQRPSNDNNNIYNDYNGHNSSHVSQVSNVTSVGSHSSQQPSAFCLALEEKMKVLPPRIRNKLERDIFVMVSNEVIRLYE
ncbi:hypothetical protein DMENIID0001_063510 [Sergentomyia squamirostris]